MEQKLQGEKESTDSNQLFDASLESHIPCRVKQNGFTKISKKETELQKQ